MVAPVTISISEDSQGNKSYRYSLGAGSVYHIGRRWLKNLGLPVPKRHTFFIFDNKVLYVIDSRPWISCIRAIEPRGLLLIRYKLITFWNRIRGAFK